MARYARQLSESGMYHVIFRGINKQDIFSEHRDYEKLKNIILKVKAETKLEIYAYCFMTNHVHLFLKEAEVGQISKIMTKILSHYATWYNIKYQRSGSLFGSRYKSEPVENDTYYLSLIRYIHQNPVKAGMVTDISKYPYSSYREYLCDETLTNTDMLLDMLNSNRDVAIKQFKELHGVDEPENFDMPNAYKISDDYIKRIIISETGSDNPAAIKQMPKDERNRIVARLINEKGVSKSALAKLTGMSRNTIASIAKLCK